MFNLKFQQFSRTHPIYFYFSRMSITRYFYILEFLEQKLFLNSNLFYYIFVFIIEEIKSRTIPCRQRSLSLLWISWILNYKFIFKSKLVAIQNFFEVSKNGTKQLFNFRTISNQSWLVAALDQRQKYETIPRNWNEEYKLSNI